MQEHPNQEYINAASGGQLEFYLREAEKRRSDFRDSLVSYRGSEFVFDKGELVDGRIPEGFKIQTKLGSLTLRTVYAYDGDWVCAWMVFSDEIGSFQLREERQLLAVKLGESGWVGSKGNGYLDRFGRFSIESVLREALGAKLRLDTEFVSGIK